MKLHISHSISKLGASIPSINLPPVATCRPDVPCYKHCYARKGRFALPRNKELLQNNLELWRTSPEQFEIEVRAARFLRWHSSGDIPDRAYLDMMARVAREHPHTSFLAFTKKCELVNRWLDENGALPANLRIVFSAWGAAFVPENPHNLPVAYVRLKKEPCDIPTDAFQCSGYCGKCVMSGCSCWDLQRGQAVCFNQH